MEPTVTDDAGRAPSPPVGPAGRQHIVVTPDTCGGKPRINGTRVRVKDVVLWHERMGMSPDEIVLEWPHLTLGDVYAALAYYDDHRALFDAEMKSEEEFAADLEARTSRTAQTSAGSNAADDPVSP
jgi:uncharacterized protein (DUF433 family)